VPLAGTWTVHAYRTQEENILLIFTTSLWVLSVTKLLAAGTPLGELTTLLITSYLSKFRDSAGLIGLAEGGEDARGILVRKGIGRGEGFPTCIATDLRYSNFGAAPASVRNIYVRQLSTCNGLVVSQRGTIFDGVKD
jgi:hypothetical protein